MDTGTLSSAMSRRTIERLTHHGVESDFYACPSVFLQRAKLCKSETKRYIPNKSTITAPLRALLKKEVEWNWTFEHNSAMNKLREVLTSEPVLAYYDVTKPVTIQADASQSGLGACLLQDGNPIAYASRSMTSAEENYAQIEKEMLAISFATKNFHQYIYGKPSIHEQTYHKPLESILKKNV